jgi:hypothetical protein
MVNSVPENVIQDTHGKQDVYSKMASNPITTLSDDMDPGFSACISFDGSEVDGLDDQLGSSASESIANICQSKGKESGDLQPLLGKVYRVENAQLLEDIATASELKRADDNREATLNARNIEKREFQDEVEVLQ